MEFAALDREVGQVFRAIQKMAGRTPTPPAAPRSAEAAGSADGR
jgi:hypothetical protein